MSRVIELIGNTDAANYWSGQTLCPMSGEIVKSVFCPKRQVCVLPELLIKAVNRTEAMAFAAEAQSNKEVPNCLNGKPFKVRSSLTRSALNPADYF